MRDDRRRFMTNARTSAVVLAGLLALLCWAGNLLRADPTTVSVFPGAMPLVAFPLVLYPALRRERRRMEHPDPLSLRRAGRRIVQPAALLFALFFAALAAWRWSYATDPWLPVVAFAESLVTTVVAGLACVWMCAWLLVRRTPAGSDITRPQP